VSSEGTEYPKIEYNFFQSPFILFLMAAGCARVQKIASTALLSDWIAAPVAPAAGVTSIAALEHYVRAYAGYTKHIIGTSLMGPRKDGGIVDLNLKVYGTKNATLSMLPLSPSSLQLICR